MITHHLFIIRNFIQYLDNKFVICKLKTACKTFNNFIMNEWILTQLDYQKKNMILKMLINDEKIKYVIFNEIRSYKLSCVPLFPMKNNCICYVMMNMLTYADPNYMIHVISTEDTEELNIKKEYPDIIDIYCKICSPPCAECKEILTPYSRDTFSVLCEKCYQHGKFKMQICSECSKKN